MVEAFATYLELGLRLKRTFAVGAEAEWLTSLLGDASTYLRDDVLGQQVFPRATSTFTAWPDGGRVDMPQAPVVSIDSVARGGVPVEYDRRESTIWVLDNAALDVTFTYGYATAPESLKRWTLVLVSQALLTIEQQLGLTAGGLSSIAIDDFKAAWANAGEESGITLSDRNIKLIREQFGVRAGYVVTTR